MCARWSSQPVEEGCGGVGIACYLNLLRRDAVMLGCGDCFSPQPSEEGCGGMHVVIARHVEEGLRKD